MTFPRWRTGSDVFHVNQQWLVCQSWRTPTEHAWDFSCSPSLPWLSNHWLCQESETKVLHRKKDYSEQVTDRSFEKCFLSAVTEIDRLSFTHSHMHKPWMPRVWIPQVIASRLCLPWQYSCSIVGNKHDFCWLSLSRAASGEGLQVWIWMWKFFLDKQHKHCCM